MATTQENLDKDQADFNAAFAEPDAERVEQSEDQAFGLDVEAAAAAEPDAPADEAAAVVAVVDGEALEEAAGDAVAEESAEAAADAANPEPVAETPDAEDAGDEPTDPKDIQRAKSWEGRLKAEEKRLKELAAELDAKSAAKGEAPGEAAADALEQVAEATDDPELIEAAEEAAGHVEAGTMTAEQAMKQLAEDFGPDFVKMIEVIASAKAAEAGAKAADEKVSAVSKNVEDVISHIQDEKARAHFERIADAHPDFDDVANSETFKAYVNGLTEDDKAEALRIVESGSAKEIIKLLDTYKAGAAPAEEVAVAAEEPAPPVATEVADEEDPDMDAAEGVRSAGMSLPAEPVASNASYEEAWLES